MIFSNVGDVVDLGFVALFQRVIKAVGMAGQQSQQNVLLLSDVGEQALVRPAQLERAAFQFEERPHVAQAALDEDLRCKLPGR